MKKSKLN